METKVIPSYKNGLKELRNQLKEILPTEAIEVFDKDADTLEQTHQSILKLQQGDKAPDFTLPNAVGKTVNLYDLLNEGVVVMIFYRGTWCPYCNLALSQYQQILDDIKAKGANLVAISPQKPDESLNIKEKNELRFEVLSDKANQVAKKFTTVFKNGGAPVNKMTELGFDFDAFYEDDSRELPVPAVFIINQDKEIIFAKSEGGDYKKRTESKEILDILQNI